MPTPADPALALVAAVHDLADRTADVADLKRDRPRDPAALPAWRGMRPPSRVW
jgi:hypothetical protein